MNAFDPSIFHGSPISSSSASVGRMSTVSTFAVATRPSRWPGRLMRRGTDAMSAKVVGLGVRDRSPGRRLIPWSAVTTTTASSYRPPANRARVIVRLAEPETQTRRTWCSSSRSTGRTCCPWSGPAAGFPAAVAGRRGVDLRPGLDPRRSPCSASGAGRCVAGASAAARGTGVRADHAASRGWWSRRGFRIGGRDRKAAGRTSRMAGSVPASAEIGVRPSARWRASRRGRR